MQLSRYFRINILTVNIKLTKERSFSSLNQDIYCFVCPIFFSVRGFMRTDLFHGNVLVFFSLAVSKTVGEFGIKHPGRHTSGSLWIILWRCHRFKKPLGATAGVCAPPSPSWKVHMFTCWVCFCMIGLQLLFWPRLLKLSESGTQRAESSWCWQVNSTSLRESTMKFF